MKRIILFISCVATSGMQAIHLRDVVLYQPLKLAIEQGQNCAQVQRTFADVVHKVTLSSSEQHELVRQALELAQQSKELLKKADEALGNKTYDASKLKWAATQLAGAVYCA